MNEERAGSTASHRVRVLFVCLGNICRSPTAHGVFRNLVSERGYESSIFIDSAGTGDWHVGRSPDSRATAKAEERGIDLSDLRARTVVQSDFENFDYVLAMDSQNLYDLETMCPERYQKGYQKHLGLFLDFAQNFSQNEVPDPYYGGDEGFDLVFDMVQDGCEGLLADICQRYSI